MKEVDEFEGDESEDGKAEVQQDDDVDVEEPQEEPEEEAKDEDVDSFAWSHDMMPRTINADGEIPLLAQDAFLAMRPMWGPVAAEEKFYAVIDLVEWLSFVRVEQAKDWDDYLNRFGEYYDQNVQLLLVGPLDTNRKSLGNLIKTVCRKEHILVSEGSLVEQIRTYETISKLNVYDAPKNFIVYFNQDRKTPFCFWIYTPKGVTSVV